MIYNFYEYKLTTENYSKYYYLVLRLNEKTFENLISGKFKNLKGISDNVEIINRFFDIRDILLIMDKKSVKELNDIEEVKYYDIDFLVKDSFKNLKRLTFDNKDYIKGSENILIKKK